MHKWIAAPILALMALITMATPLLSEPRKPGPFTGRWVADLKTQIDPDHDDKYIVSGGEYQCDSCEPQRAYPADGRLRPVRGTGVSESVTISGPRSIVTHIVEQSRDRRTTMSAAADDQTATYVSIDKLPRRPERFRTIYLARRVAPTPPGAHPVSGSWRAVRYVEVPLAYRTVEIRLAGQQVSIINPLKSRYTALLNGPPVPVSGLDSDVRAQVRMIDGRTMLETLLDAGKPVLTRTYTLSSDGRSIEMATTNLNTHETFAATSRRQ